MTAAALPEIEAEAITPLVDLTGGAGSAERVTASAMNQVSDSFAHLSDALAAHVKATDAGHQAAIHSQIDNDLDRLAADHPDDPEGFDKARAEYRTGLVKSVPGRYAQAAAGYVDQIGQKASTALYVAKAHDQTVAAKSALEQRKSELEGRLDAWRSQGPAAMETADYQQDFAAYSDVLTQLGNPVFGGSAQEAAARIEVARTRQTVGAALSMATAIYKGEVAGPVPTPSMPPSQGMIAAGNLDPWHRKVLKNDDGSYSTTSSISIGTDQGEVLIPTVVEGYRLSNEEAIAHYQKTGENLGTFDTPEHANAYAKELHNRQAAYIDAQVHPQGGLASARAFIDQTVNDPHLNLSSYERDRLANEAREHVNLLYQADIEATRAERDAEREKKAAQRERKADLSMDAYTGALAPGDVMEAVKNGDITEPDGVALLRMIKTATRTAGSGGHAPSEGSMAALIAAAGGDKEAAKAAMKLAERGVIDPSDASDIAGAYKAARSNPAIAASVDHVSTLLSEKGDDRKGAIAAYMKQASLGLIPAGKEMQVANEVVNKYKGRAYSTLPAPIFATQIPRTREDIARSAAYAKKALDAGRISQATYLNELNTLQAWGAKIGQGKK